MREGLCRVLIGPAVFGVLDQSGGDSPNGHPRAANELTITEWNPVSKQPLFKVGEGHAAEAAVYHTCNTLAKQCEAHAEMLGPFVDRYDEEKPAEPDRPSTTSSSTRRAREAWGCCATCRTFT